RRTVPEPEPGPNRDGPNAPRRRGASHAGDTERARPPPVPRRAAAGAAGPGRPGERPGGGPRPGAEEPVAGGRRRGARARGDRRARGGARAGAALRAPGDAPGARRVPRLARLEDLAAVPAQRRADDQPQPRRRPALPRLGAPDRPARLGLPPG